MTNGQRYVCGFWAWVLSSGFGAFIVMASDAELRHGGVATWLVGTVTYMKVFAVVLVIGWLGAHALVG